MRISAVLPLAAALLFAGCESDDESPDGVWQLVAVGDESVPAEPESGVLVVDGSIEIEGDSLIWRETLVVGADSPEPDQTFETRAASAFERDGSLLISRPEAFDPIPDDMFVHCAIGGVYRVENGATQLRLIDVVQDGQCGTGIDPFMARERIYSRLGPAGW